MLIDRADHPRLRPERAGGRAFGSDLMAVPADGRHLRRLLLPADPPAAEEGEGSAGDARGAAERRRGRHRRRHRRPITKLDRPVRDRRDRAERRDHACSAAPIAQLLPKGTIKSARDSASGARRAAHRHHESLSRSGSTSLIAVALVVGIALHAAELLPRSAGGAGVVVEGERQDRQRAARAPSRTRSRPRTSRYRGAALDADRLKVRFDDPDTQLKAKDVLQAKLGENYIVALNLLSASPHWLAAIGALPMYLGLDLRGGVHFLLQVDMKAALDKAADRYTTDIRSLMREKKIQYAGVAREGSNVVDALPRRGGAHQGARRDREGVPRSRAARAATAPAASSGSSRALKPEAQKRIQDGAVQQNITILRNRVNELGVAEPIIQQQGADRVVVQLPGVQDTARAKDILGRTATLEIRMVNDEPGALEAALAGQRAARQRPVHRAQRRAAPGAAAGRADRRPHQRRAARASTSATTSPPCTSTSTAPAPASSRK